MGQQVLFLKLPWPQCFVQYTYFCDESGFFICSVRNVASSLKASSNFVQNVNMHFLTRLCITEFYALYIYIEREREFTRITYVYLYIFRLFNSSMRFY